MNSKRGTYRAFSDLQFDMNFTNGGGCRNFWRKPKGGVSSAGDAQDQASADNNA
jgi:hypothetical protein